MITAQPAASSTRCTEQLCREKKVMMFGQYNVGLHEVVVDCVAGVEIPSSFSADVLDVHDPVECMGGANCVYVLRRFWLATFCYVLNRIAPKKDPADIALLLFFATITIALTRRLPWVKMISKVINLLLSLQLLVIDGEKCSWLEVWRLFCFYTQS